VVSHIYTGGKRLQNFEYRTEMNLQPQHEVTFGYKKVHHVLFGQKHTAKHNMASALFPAFTQRMVAIPYRRFGTTYRSRLQGTRNPRRNVFEIQAGTSWIS
jgi:hypothetical protein